MKKIMMFPGSHFFRHRLIFIRSLFKVHIASSLIIVSIYLLCYTGNANAVDKRTATAFFGNATQEILRHAFLEKDFAASERVFRGAIDELRASRSYFDDYLFVVDADLHSYYTWALLANGGDWNKAAALSHESINIIYLSLKEQRKREIQSAQQREQFVNGLLGVASMLSSYYAAKNGSNVVFRPPWIDVEPDLDSIPKIIPYDKNRAGDGVRFAVIRPQLWSNTFSADMDWLKSLARIITKNGFCTASLVHPRVVLTNGHCVQDGMPREVRFEGLLFSDVYKPTTYFTSQGEHEAWKDHDWQNDWALVVLDRPVEDIEPLKMRGRVTQGFAERLEGGLALAGYSGDLNHGEFLTLHYGCSPTRLERSNIMIANCRAWKGASGSPVIDMKTGTVVGLHAFGFHGDDRVTCADKGIETECIGGGPMLMEAMKKLNEIEIDHLK